MSGDPSRCIESLRHREAATARSIDDIEAKIGRLQFARDERLRALQNIRRSIAAHTASPVSSDRNEQH